MLFSFNDLRQFPIEARDGRKGQAADLYFNDEDWRVVYAVAESGFLFTKQQGLVHASLLGEPDTVRRALPVALTKDELDEAETPEAHPPVSEQRDREVRLSQLEFWPPLMIGAPGAVYTPEMAERQLLLGGTVRDRELVPETEPEGIDRGDPHLRSLKEVSGYAIAARDGEIGTAADFLLDPDGWRIRYIVVDIGSWLAGRQVAIRPDWVSDVSWDGRSIVVRVDRDEVSDARELAQIDDLERSDAHLAIAPFGAYGAPV